MLNNRVKYITTNVLLVSMTFFLGCSGSMFSSKRASTRFIYNYTLLEPVKNDQMLYKDDYINIQFKLDESAVKFQLQNVTDVPISIDWQNASIVLNNRVFPVRNTNTLYQTELKKPPSVVIPSLGYIRDMVIPSENITLDNNVWVEKDFFPSDDMGSLARKKLIMKYVGSRVKLLLPIKISEIVEEYTFTFRVKSITEVPQNMLPPPKERPKPPPVSITAAQASQSLLPIIIAGGILAVAIYALSKEKPSPTDF